MNKFTPKFSRFNIWLTILVFVLMLVSTTYFIASSTISLAQGNQPVKSSAWFSMIAVDLFTIWAWLSFFWHIYVFRNTEYTEDGITKPTLRGIRTLRWSEIINIERDVYLRCFIYTETMEWSIPLTFYENYAELLEYMINQVKKHRNVDNDGT